MKKFESILLIGSNVKKAGKTTLACSIINKFAKINNIYAVKISCSDKNLHELKNQIISNENYIIFEDKNKNNNTDTSRYSASGAKRAFFLQSKKIYLEEAFEVFLNKISTDTMLICESASLRLFIEPGVFLFIEKQEDDNNEEKEQSEALIKWADKIIHWKDGNFNFDLNNILLSKGKWFLKK